MRTLITRRYRNLIGALAALAVVSTLAACGDEGDSSTDATNTSTAGIAVSDVWARNSPMMATAGAAYMVIETSTDDALVGVAVDVSVAGKAEIHETVMSEMPAGTDITMNSGMPMGTDMSTSGEMTMRPVDRLEIAAGTRVELMPGGYHVMLLDLAAPLELGSNFDIVLTFEKAGDVTVTAEVREEAP